MVHPNPGKAGLFRNTAAGIVGNVLEWYDFAVFGYLAPIIGKNFFPSENRSASLIGAFAVFAGAYLMRPLGAMLFGHFGDRLGRKAALRASVLMMAVPTVAMAILPTHAQAGWLAAVLLLLCRLAQGLSVGGELIGSVSFITEIAPPHRRGLFGSLTLFSSTAGVMLGSAVAALITALVGASAMESWGWRLPFAAGIFIAWFGVWMRRGISETPHFEELRESGRLSRNPVAEVTRSMPGRVSLVANLVVLTGGGFYLLFVWWPTYLTDVIRPPVPHALVLNTLSMAVLTAAIPLAGWLSDFVGRRPVLLVSAAGVGLSALPLFALAAHGTMASALLAQTCFAVLMAGISGPIPATMVELFPTRLRYSGVALGYNISLAIFGGTAPLIATLLVSRTGHLLAPACYLAFLAAVSLIACLGVHRFPAVDMRARYGFRPAPPTRGAPERPPPRARHAPPLGSLARVLGEEFHTP